LLAYPARSIKKWSGKQIAAGKIVARQTSRFAGIKVSNLRKEMYIIRKKI